VMNVPFAHNDIKLPGLRVKSQDKKGRYAKIPHRE
jgi:hypothetical protein